MDDWKLQVSVGAVLCDETNKEPFSMLLQQADKAMYESKQHKGNHMIFA
ncbi:MAG: GGDEF domain-containing protein [Butyrivibrio sp.]|nr:GGDEF domain-containing protein [Butyrivibrio sp.]